MSEMIELNYQYKGDNSIMKAISYLPINHPEQVARKLGITLSFRKFCTTCAIINLTDAREFVMHLVYLGYKVNSQIKNNKMVVEYSL